MLDFSLIFKESEPNRIEQKINKWSPKLSADLEKIVLFGAGYTGIVYMEYLKEYGFGERLLFCDNSSIKWGSFIQDIPVISLNELKDKYPNSHIVITTYKYRNNIYNQLKDNSLHDNLVESNLSYMIEADVGCFSTRGYKKLLEDNLVSFEQVYSSLADGFSKKLFLDRINYCITNDPQYLIPLKSKQIQYFDKDVISLEKDEIFIDGGTCSGETIFDFIELVSGEFKRVYSFEPEEPKQKNNAGKFSEFENIKFMSCGLWSESKNLRFSIENNGSSHIDSKGEVEVPVTSIDEILNGQEATFIKLDVEGAEIEALKGAKETIKKYRPKMAVCIYHKPLDIVQIPILLKELVPEYKLFMRHYGDDLCETVIYAI